MTATAAPITEPTAEPILTLTLAGRTFRSATPRTMGQRVYWDHLLRRAGVTRLPTTVEAWDDLVAQLQATDTLQYLVACALVEEVNGRPKAWTRPDAEANAAFFWSLTDPADLTQLQAAIGVELLRFFPLGRPSPATSPNSSGSSGTPMAATGLQNPMTNPA